MWTNLFSFLKFVIPRVRKGGGLQKEMEEGKETEGGAGERGMKEGRRLYATKMHEEKFQGLSRMVWVSLVYGDTQTQGVVMGGHPWIGDISGVHVRGYSGWTSPD